MNRFVDALCSIFDTVIASLARIERDLCTAALGMDGAEAKPADGEQKQV